MASSCRTSAFLLGVLLSLQLLSTQFVAQAQCTQFQSKFLNQIGQPGPFPNLQAITFNPNLHTCDETIGFYSAYCIESCASPNQCACEITCQQVGGPTNYGVACVCPASGTRGCTDPHFTGAYGVQYDFQGVPDKNFNIISDTDVNVNAHFIGQNGEDTGFDGTWMSGLGVSWNEGCVVRHLTVTVTNDDVHSTKNPFTFELDNEKLDALALEDSVISGPAIIHRDEGLAISRNENGRSHTIDINSHIVIKIVAASHEHPTGNHIDFKLEKLNVTATVHGVLGQTFAESHRALLQEALASGSNSTNHFDASDIVEGKDADYLTSSLLATDNKFNRFAKPCKAFTSNKQSVALLRKILGLELDAPMKQVVPGAIPCTSQLNGRLKCNS